MSKPFQIQSFSGNGQTLLLGETPLEQAPKARLSNGSECIPQHFLEFNHDMRSIRQILKDIRYSDRYPLFVCEDSGGIYLQVGVIGADNYQRKNEQPLKIVYGRKWRVEPELPSSEIIQTAFLAIKTAREHEVRELFRLKERGFTCTPFNNHHDLPLMAQHQSLLKCSSSEHQTPDAELKNTLAKIHYDHSRFQLQKLTRLTEELWLLHLDIDLDKKTQLPELLAIKEQPLALLLHKLDYNHLYHQLMDTCLQLSNAHVEENFCYQNFARFSRTHSIEAIANLSATLRQQHEDTEFSTRFEQSNYNTDRNRVPSLDQSDYSQRLRQQLAQFQPLDGIQPVSL